MFSKFEPNGFTSPIDGIEMKTLTYGDKTLLTRFNLKKDSVLPRHFHPHEQTGYLVSGNIKLIIGETEYNVYPGDSWCIKSDIEHQAIIIEDSVAIEVFSPVRKDYLPDETNS